MKQVAVWTILAAILGAQFSGCSGSGDLERTDVTGSVTLDGQPIPFGLLFLKGQPNAQQQVTQVYLAVRDGKFSSREQKVAGPSPGENTITITIYEGPPPADEDAAGPKIRGAYTATVNVTGNEPVNIEMTSADLENSK